MTKQTQIIFIVAIIAALIVGWLGGRWYTGYQIEHQMDKVTEEFEDYMDDLTGGDGEFDEQDILDMYELDDLTDDLTDDMPSGDDIVCNYDEQVFTVGDSYYDGCNWCSCQDDGLMLCTERACEAE